MIIKSPNSLISVSIGIENQHIGYSVEYNNQLIIKFSKLGFKTNKGSFLKGNIVSSEEKEVVDSWKPLYGAFSEVSNLYNELRIRFQPESRGINLKSGYEIVFRVYDDGVGFRYEISEEFLHQSGILTINKEFTEINIADYDTFWAYAGENDLKGPHSHGKTGNFRLPILFHKPKKYSICVLEAGLNEYSNISLKLRRNDKILLKSGKNSVFSPYVSPWRAIKIGSTIASLGSSMLPANLNPPCKIENKSWIKPGKSMWDWRVWGYKTEDGFEYGLNTESHKRLVDFAAENNVQYLLIDADWYGSEFNKTSDPLTARSNIKIEELMEYAKNKGIGVILYLNDVGAKKYGVENILKKFSEWDASGVKYGFMKGSGQSKVLWTQKVIELAAKYELLLDFHDNPIPPSGTIRSWPNVVAREFGYAQADGRKIGMPHNIIGMLLVNMNAGCLDLTYGWYGLTNAHIGRPRVFGPIPGTVVAENARFFMINTGLAVLPDAPEEYLKKSDLFQFIREMDVNWDETIILDGYPNEFIIMARRKGNKWFAAAITDEQPRNLVIETAFLKEDVNYKIREFKDSQTSHYLNEKENYSINESKIQSGTKISISLVSGGGWCAIFDEL